MHSTAAKKDFKKEINQYSKQIDQESDSVSFNLIKSGKLILFLFSDIEICIKIN